MNIKSELENRLNAQYESLKFYLNNKDCCKSLHNMCQNCEQYMGLEQHNYEDCKDKHCFKHYLAYSLLKNYISYELFPEQ